MKLIPYSDLKEKKGIKYSRAHVSRLEKADKFPKHVNLGPQSIGWLESEVDDWIAAKAAERSTSNDADPVESADERKAENAELYPEDQGAAS
jgi:prophage regulatory protein